MLNKPIPPISLQMQEVHIDDMLNFGGQLILLHFCIFLGKYMNRLIMIWSYWTLKTHLCMLIKPILRQMTNGELIIAQCIYKVGIRCFGGLPQGVDYKL